MTPLFVTPYPDELVYSILARVYQRSGYISGPFFRRQILKNPKAHPDVAFLNSYKKEIERELTRKESMENIVFKRTMFPMYGRFLSKEKRNRLYQSLVSMEHRGSLSAPQASSGRPLHLMYCAVCADEDRREYGETYWHREHQISTVILCPKHCCRLVESKVRTGGASNVAFVPAETAIPRESESYIESVDNLLKDFTDYVRTVFCTPINLSVDTSGVEYLRIRIRQKSAYGRYVSDKALRCALKVDFSDLYCAIHASLLQGRSARKVVEQQFFSVRDGRFVSFLDICMLGFIAQIPPEDLGVMRMDS